ncbi:MAG: Acyl-CoA dehydrogenase [Hydrocarboniphaga sp.]|uniref:acyl-CoA dehydrogenase family protein n=1 Tax=Hydrocarboniphaga sp. TaxID=2033016 RepID=UPI0026240F1F|nr:acyl-CoA dehydrogenase family protein [Hydrocarboniphaga sp.]MDB5968334.1 Acyl-CoA dehydrogenase [Hydrocarboniphaga sp.]
MIPRSLFSPEHEQFRDAVRKFIEREITPHHERWEEEGKVDRELWLKAGEAGLLCPNLAEAYGGYGADFLFNVIITEEMARAGATGPGFSVHSDMVATYIASFGSEQQKQHWLPKMAAGQAIGALGLTEPSAGSDLKAIRTRALRDGDEYVISGQKVYISNGQLCDIIVLACKTDPAAGAKGMSFILVEADRAGFRRGRNLKKIGLKAQDTSELFFDEVRVPLSNLLGTEGSAFKMAMSKLAEERLTIAVSAITVAESALRWTIDYTKERKAFGQTISDFQNTRFKIAELHADTLAKRVFVDRCIALHLDKQLSAVDAAAAKMLCTELQCKVVDECLQFFGGYGYMLEYPIARAYIDSRIRKIAGGASEIMREIIGRELFAKNG